MANNKVGSFAFDFSLLYDISVILGVSTGLYGVNVALSVACLYLLTTTRDQTQYRPAKLVIFFIYILGMLGLATYAVVSVSQNTSRLSGITATGNLSPGGLYPQGEATIALPFMILGADAFMVCI